MIRYSLTCADGHGFEGWFRDSVDYEKQRRRRLVECPHCGSARVSKALMAPNLATAERKAESRRERQQQTKQAAQPATEAAGEAETSLKAATPGGMPKELVDLLRQVRKEVMAKSEYVGDRFAEEARRIHNEEAEARGIYGEARLEEVRELHEDGIECYPLPMLPEDKN